MPQPLATLGQTSASFAPDSGQNSASNGLRAGAADTRGRPGSTPLRCSCAEGRAASEDQGDLFAVERFALEQRARQRMELFEVLFEDHRGAMRAVADDALDLHVRVHARRIPLAPTAARPPSGPCPWRSRSPSSRRTSCSVARSWIRKYASICEWPSAVRQAENCPTGKTPGFPSTARHLKTAPTGRCEGFRSTARRLSHPQCPSIVMSCPERVAPLGVIEIERQVRRRSPGWDGDRRLARLAKDLERLSIREEQCHLIGEPIHCLPDLPIGLG